MLVPNILHRVVGLLQVLIASSLCYVTLLWPSRSHVAPNLLYEATCFTLIDCFCCSLYILWPLPPRPRAECPHLRSTDSTPNPQLLSLSQLTALSLLAVRAHPQRGSSSRLVTSSLRGLWSALRVIQLRELPRILKLYHTLAFLLVILPES
jgi:hypothetical protein